MHREKRRERKRERGRDVKPLISLCCAWKKNDFPHSKRLLASDHQHEKARKGSHSMQLSFPDKMHPSNPYGHTPAVQLSWIRNILWLASQNEPPPRFFDPVKTNSSGRPSPALHGFAKGPTKSLPALEPSLGATRKKWERKKNEIEIVRLVSWWKYQLKSDEIMIIFCLVLKYQPKSEEKQLIWSEKNHFEFMKKFRKETWLMWSDFKLEWNELGRLTWSGYSCDVDAKWIRMRIQWIALWCARSLCLSFSRMQPILKWCLVSDATRGSFSFRNGETPLPMHVFRACGVCFCAPSRNTLLIR